MEKENIKAYMLYKIDEDVTVMECIKSEIAILVLSMLSLYLGTGYIVFMILDILPIFVYGISVIKLKDEYLIEGVYYILHNGILMLCFSYIFAMMSLEIVFRFLEKDERNLAIGMMVLGYIVAILLYKYTIRKKIKNNEYAGEKEKVKGASFYIAIAVLGAAFARAFLKDMDQISGAKVLCVLSLFVSFVCLIGIFDIARYRYLIKHKELLEGLDEGTIEQG